MTRINELLTKFEKEYDPVSIFAYKETTSWIRIKNSIMDAANPDIQGMDSARSFSLSGIYLLLISLWNFLRALFAKKKPILFFGAGSGVFNYNDNTYDSYFPYSIEKMSDVNYFISADYPKKLVQYKNFLNKRHAIVFSFIVAPLTMCIAPVVSKIVKLKNTKSLELLLSDLKEFSIEKKELEKWHGMFISRYFVFSFLTIFARANRAYIVSAYSYSELCAVLRKKSIPVYELQHGYIGQGHRGYNYSISDSRLPTPDFVCVYNEFWKSELSDLGYYKKDQIKITGRLKYDLLRPNLDLSFNFIVITGQGCFYKEWELFLLDGAKFLTEENLTTKLVYIPHPNEAGDEFNSFIKNLASSTNILVGRKGDYTTEEYIFYSLAHVSVFSSCHFDAVFYKNKTYIFDVLKGNDMNYYAKRHSDIFIKINSVKDIIRGCHV